MKPNLVLQYLTSEMGRILMLEEPNVQWLMRHVEKDNLLLDISSKRHSISAEEIRVLPRHSSSFIIQNGVKKDVSDFNPMFEAVFFIFSRQTGKYAPKVYRPAVKGKENFML